ncbi:PKD domain-containing protein [Methanocella paludicola]|nr:PKD domain-containing protein [Methanocella paludicola]
MLIIQFTLPVTSEGEVEFHADVTSGNAPLTVHFTVDSPTHASNPVWNLGDGSGVKELNPTHTYNTPGTYDVSLTIDNGSGGRTTTVKTGYITVYEPPPAGPVAEFLVNTTSGEAPLYVQFTGMASGGTLSYDWDFGDGTQHSAEQSPLHIYSQPANYTVKLKVTNPGGTDIKEVLISVAEPTVTINNSTQMVTGTITPAPTVVPPTATPQSIIPSVSIPSISLSSDILQLILAALAALVIAGAIIYYFTHLSKSDSSGEKPARDLMRKPRSPVQPRRAQAAKPPAKAPETPKPQPKPANPPAPVAKPPAKAPEKPAPVVQPPAKAPEKPAPVVQPPAKAPEKPAPVVQPPAKAPEKPAPAVQPPAKAPEVPKPQPKPETKPAPVAQPPVKAPEAPKPPVKAPEAPKPQPKPESIPAPAAKPPAKAPEKPAKAPTPAPKPIKKDSDLDQDYIYGLVLGKDSETQKDGTKKN